MRATNRLLSPGCRITLFTRQNCGLCESAKTALEQARRRREFALRVVDVAGVGNAAWKGLYDFDVPVVRFLSSFGDVVGEVFGGSGLWKDCDDDYVYSCGW